MKRNQRSQIYPSKVQVVQHGSCSVKVPADHKVPSEQGTCRKLPPEILASLFIWCNSGPVRLPPHIDDAPFSVSQVCSVWRMVALSVSELWNNIMILPRLHPDRARESSLLNMCLLRCPNALVSLEATKSARSHKRTALDSFEDIILPYGQRLCRLNFILPYRQLAAFFTIPANSLVHLTHLRLETEFPPSTQDFDSVWLLPSTTFLGTPCVRSISIRVFGRLKPQVMNLPWFRLTLLHLTSSIILSHDCLVVLSECILIEDCRLGVICVEASSCSLTLDIILPYLHTLRLDFAANSKHYPILVERLNLPSLRDLAFHCPTGLPWSQVCHSFLISRSSCPLERLYVEKGTEGCVPDFEAIFLQSPTLRFVQLPLYTNFLNQRFWARIVMCELLPLVEELTLGIQDLDPIIDMLGVRCPVSKLSLVRIRGPSPTAQQGRRLSKLANEGLILEHMVAE